MNNSTITAVILSVDMDTEYWIQYVVFYFIIGIPGILGNTMVLFLIIKDKNLKTFFFTLIAGRSLTLIVFSLECIILGIFRICRFYMPQLYILTRLQCHFLHFLLYFCDTFSTLTMLTLACDRTLSIFKPMLYYNTLTSKHAIYKLLLLSFLTVFGKLFTTYFGPVSFSDKIQCLNFLSPTAPFWADFNYVTNLIIIVTGIIMYFTLFLAVVMKTKKAVASTTSEDSLNSIVQNMIERQSRFLSAVWMLIVVNICTVLSFNTVMLLSMYMAAPVSTRLFLYGACFASIDRFVDPIILFWKSSDLQQALKTFIGIKNQIAHYR